MSETKFRGKPLADCTLEDLHDARDWAEAEIDPLYDRDGARLSTDDAKALYEGARRQIEEELAARRAGSSKDDGEVKE